MRILALATHPVEGASTRHRILAYRSFLERHGHELVFHAFFPSAAYSTISRGGTPLKKLYYVLRGSVERAARLRGGGFELLLIHREVFPLGWTCFASLLARRTFRVVYDYDDAMFLPQRGDRWILSKLENSEGARHLIALSDAVIAGNSFLHAYAKRHNPRVTVIPTSIDTAGVAAKAHVPGCGKCVIGWIGSHTTEKYVHSLRPVLRRLSARGDFLVKIVGAQRRFRLDGVEVAQLPWEMARESDDFRSCGIGIYPLWNDEWAQGKCGFKAIQFMAAGVPVVASAVGANREIIGDGVNGFLAASEEEWCEKLSLLIRDPALRQKLGQAGRQTVEARYSLAANAPKFLSVLTDASRW